VLLIRGCAIFNELAPILAVRALHLSSV